MDNMKKYYLYMHIAPSNKVYIGITSQDLETRWKRGYGYKTQQLFWRAIEKYGWDNIHHIIIKENLTKDEAERLEIELISLFDSTNPNKGYNVSHGGLLNSGGHNLSEEAKKKIGKRNKGKKLSIDTCKKMSESRKGEKNWAYGKKFSNEHKKALSESHLGIIPSNAKPVICVETGKQYVSISEARRKEGINNISIVCDKNNRTADGYHWKYLNEEMEEILCTA